MLSPAASHHPASRSGWFIYHHSTGTVVSPLHGHRLAHVNARHSDAPKDPFRKLLRCIALRGKKKEEGRRRKKEERRGEEDQRKEEGEEDRTIHSNHGTH